MGERAADGAAVAHLRVADVDRRRGPGAAPATRSTSDVSRSRWRVRRADGDVVAGVADVATGRVSRPMSTSTAGVGQPQLHERQQRVAAGEELGLVAVLGEQRDRFVGRVGPHVVEGGGDHVRTALAGRGEDRLDDVVVAGAAAEVALEALAHLAPRSGAGSPSRSDTAAITMPGVQ